MWQRTWANHPPQKSVDDRLRIATDETDNLNTGTNQGPSRKSEKPPHGELGFGGQKTRRRDQKNRDLPA
jgi:hypothetical protein